MKSIFIIILIYNIQLLFATSEQQICSSNNMKILSMLQQNDNWCYQRIASTNNLKDLFYLKSVAEKNGYNKSLTFVNNKLFENSNIDELCQYISTYCNSPQNPNTLNRILYNQHSIEIISALSILQNLLLAHTQDTQDNNKVNVLKYYNIICRTIKSWS